MKIKVFTLFLSVIVIILAIVSCVKLPVTETSKDQLSQEDSTSAPDTTSEPDTTGENSPEESSQEDTTTSEESSVEDSSAEDSSEETTTEESSEEESSQVVIELPYPTLEGVTYANLTSSEYDKYFENSMFIGNSVMVHFYNFYSNKKSKISGFLGGCKFFSSSNYSALEDTKAVNDSSWHPKYQNVKMKCGDAVAQAGVTRVFLSVMALNEIALHNAKTCVDDNFQTTVDLINSIKQKSPDVEIVVLSNTYMVFNYNSYARLNNGNISALNNKVLEYCNQNGIDFIDLSTFLMDGNVLADKYCRDYEKDDSNQGCHLTNEAYALWIATLRNYACLKQNDAWTNPASMPVYTKNP
ncbi:MAG: hypothetical protein GX148_04585 [Clostridiales bacterium]|jgi:hypothetical protein|nr:hypothetical protein [Clostridiales bacterium]